MTCTTEEQYLSATIASNLRVEADRNGPADILIVCGWTASMIGHALIRLHSKPSTAALALVHEKVSAYAASCNIERPDAVAGAVIAWQLDKVCKTCHGRKFDAIAGTPSLSEIRCPVCKGTGEAKLPYGEAGRILASWLDFCKASAVDGIKRRLRG
jgi:hypothetical protein